MLTTQKRFPNPCEKMGGYHMVRGYHQPRVCVMRVATAQKGCDPGAYVPVCSKQPIFLDSQMTRFVEARLFFDAPEYLGRSATFIFRTTKRTNRIIATLHRNTYKRVVFLLACPFIRGSIGAKTAPSVAKRYRKPNVSAYRNKPAGQVSHCIGTPIAISSVFAL